MNILYYFNILENEIIDDSDIGDESTVEDSSEEVEGSGSTSTEA